MEINKDSINYILEKLALLLSGLFPGILILEIYFDIGIFSKNLDTFFSVFLYLIWIIILSIPFHYFIADSVSNYNNKVFDAYAKVENIPSEDFKKLVKNTSPEFKERLKNIESHIQFGFTVLQSLIFYIVYKGIKYYNFDNFTFWNIPNEYLNFFIVMFITYLLSFPSGYIYAFLNITRFEYSLKKH